jgi:hypothetical protein
MGDAESGARIERVIENEQRARTTRKHDLRRNSSYYRSIKHHGNGFNCENLEIW